MTTKIITTRIFQGLTQGLSIVTAGVLLACYPISASAQGNGTTHPSGSFSTTLFDFCTGEFVDVNVTVQSVVHSFIDSAGGVHGTETDVFSASGVGETTGTVYLANQTDSSSFNGQVGVAMTSPIHFSIISKGGSSNLQEHLLFHLTVNADGTATVSIGNITITCN